MANLLRQPRGIVKVNDVVVNGFIEAENESNGYYEADTFRVKIPAANVDMTALVALDEVKVEILAGFPANPQSFDASELTSLIIGLVDEMQYDPHARIVTLSGRDLTSRLIDAKTTEKFANKTAGEIANILAARHGLNPVVTATTTKVGQYYQIDQVRLTDTRSEWDLLTWLANEEVTADGRKFVAYVNGNDLHFEPETPPDSDPYVIRWQEPDNDAPYRRAQATNLSFERNLTVLKNIVVTVRSWGQKQKKPFAVSYPSSGSTIAPGASTSKKQLYEYRFPNLTQEQALRKAQAIQHDLTLQEVRMHASMPCDPALTPRRLVQVVGTGTVFDQNYYPRSIHRQIGADGFQMRFEAKNHSPESQVAL